MQDSTHSPKVSFVGAPASGKTALVKRCAEDRFITEYEPTLGSNLAVATRVDGGQTVRIIISDLGGSSLYHGLGREILRGTAVIVAVYDLSRLETMASTREWIEIAKEASPHASLIVVGNKTDMSSSEDFLDSLDPKSLVVGYDAFHVTVSAKTGEGVDTLINLIWEQVRQVAHR